jgi:acetyl-CoA C-acetyltransferase
MSLHTGMGDGAVTAGSTHASFPEVVASAAEAYAQAGISIPREQLDLAEVHDCFTPTELILMEDLGLSERGQAWKDIVDGRFDLDGSVAVNPDGGLKSFGHPVGASGLRMMFEAWLQLRGQAGARQLQDPRLAMTHNMGGMPGEFLSFVSIFGKDLG